MTSANVERFGLFLWATSVKFGRLPTVLGEFDQSRGDLYQVGASSAKFLGDFGHFGRHRAISTKLGPNSTKLGAKSATFGRIRPPFLGAKFCRCSAILTKFGANSTRVGHFWQMCILVALATGRIHPLLHRSTVASPGAGYSFDRPRGANM